MTLRSIGATLPLLLLTACGSGGVKPLNPATFIQPTADTRIDQRREAMDDRPGQLLVGARVDQSPAPAPVTPPSTTPPDRPFDQPLAPPDVTGVNETVRNSVKSSADAATQRAQSEGVTPQPAAPVSSATPGEYMTLGAVVVEVNGNPIYANKILGDITPVLAAKAKETAPEDFRAVALSEVRKQVQVLIRTEVEYAAAQRNLDKKDQELARNLTEQWRDQQITQAGGSIESARARARADGQEFDEIVEDQYRVEMRRIYFQKKEFPKVQVTAQDMRDFYNKHREDAFTQHDQAKFRVIKIGFTQSGGKDEALKKITALRERIVKGEDFATVAGTTNDDSGLLSSKGDVGMGDWIQRGAFASEAVENAVWNLKPGEVTPVIEVPKYYEIAQLTEKQEGKVASFDDGAIQAEIRRALEAQQFNAMRDAVQMRLMSEAVIQPDQPRFEPAVEMAMQMYPVWAKKK